MAGVVGVAVPAPAVPAKRSSKPDSSRLLQDADSVARPGQCKIFVPIC